MGPPRRVGFFMRNGNKVWHSRAHRARSSLITFIRNINAQIKTPNALIQEHVGVSLFSIEPN